MNFNAVEGAAFTNQQVATFTDPNTRATAADYSAMVDWGDSTTSAGTITGGNGSFSVTGSHTYAEEGSYTVTVTITDVDNSSNSAAPTATATVADAALTAACAMPPVTPTPFSGNVATFSDAAGTYSDPADMSATIDWGDTTSSSGTVTSNGGGNYTVSGSHSYGSTGTFTVKVDIADLGGSKTQTSCAVLIFAFAPGGGSFVIGDRNSAINTSVTLWGAQWPKLNSLSGGPAPSAFKGFALNPKTPSCNVGWSTDPGNSAPPPPGPLPTFMGVIATSSTTQSGRQISGNTPHIVVVRTNPGYDGNPGHAGTGRVVAQYC